MEEQESEQILDLGLDSTESEPQAAAHTYLWERGYQRTWDSLAEDKGGRLFISLSKRDIESRTAAQRTAMRETSEAVRKGMIRRLYIVMDASSNMQEGDFRPTRWLSVQALLDQFVKEFFDQNPMGQIGIVLTQDGGAEIWSELSGNSGLVLASCKSLFKSFSGGKVQNGDEDRELVGEPSLQNALEKAHSSLKFVPKHGSREICIVFGSLATWDPGDITNTITQMRSDKIRVSAISLTAEIFILKHTCSETGGTFRVAVDERHLCSLLMQWTVPPVLTNEFHTDPSLLRMGFPDYVAENVATPCACHPNELKKGGYYCPKCGIKSCDMPSECKICGLTLASSAYLARSYCHLFPPPVFSHIQPPNISVPGTRVVMVCFGCGTSENTGSFSTNLEVQQQWYKCPSCSSAFCMDCDGFIHESLHTCPGCEIQK